METPGHWSEKNKGVDTCCPLGTLRTVPVDPDGYAPPTKENVHDALTVHGHRLVCHYVWSVRATGVRVSMNLLPSYR